MINLKFGKAQKILLALIISLACHSIACAAQPVFDISGDWDSTYGAIKFEMDGLDKNGNAIISGSYQGDNKQAPITWGRLFREKDRSIARIEYYMYWKPMYGYAEFVLDPAKGILNGSYFQGGSTGKWVLTRKKGGNLKLRSDLSPKEPRTSRGDILTTVVGIWDSSFGVVNLIGSSKTENKELRGTFKRPDGKVGEITSGTFIKTADGGKLEIKYYCPWNHVRGKATFFPAKKIEGRMLMGTYTQGNQTGPWNLCRPAKEI